MDKRYLDSAFVEKEEDREGILWVSRGSYCDNNNWCYVGHSYILAVRGKWL